MTGSVSSICDSVCDLRVFGRGMISGSELVPPPPPTGSGVCVKRACVEEWCVVAGVPDGISRAVVASRWDSPTVRTVAERLLLLIRIFIFSNEDDHGQL